MGLDERTFKEIGLTRADIESTALRLHDGAGKSDLAPRVCIALRNIAHNKPTTQETVR